VPAGACASEYLVIGFVVVVAWLRVNVAFSLTLLCVVIVVIVIVIVTFFVVTVAVVIIIDVVVTRPTSQPIVVSRPHLLHPLFLFIVFIFNRVPSLRAASSPVVPAWMNGPDPAPRSRLRLRLRPAPPALRVALGQGRRQRRDGGLCRGRGR
jgi:hypothetical protein